MHLCGLFIKRRICKAFFLYIHIYIAHFRVDSLGETVWSCNMSSYCLMYTVCSCRWVSECISQSFFFLLGRSPPSATAVSRVSSCHSRAAWLAICRWWTVLQLSRWHPAVPAGNCSCACPECFLAPFYGSMFTLLCLKRWKQMFFIHPYFFTNFLFHTNKNLF